MSAPHSWHPVNLSEASLTPPDPPTIGGLIYPGRHHLISGEPESLKSWLALALVVDELNHANSVVYIDLEMGARMVAERIRALNPELFLPEHDNLDRGLHYLTPDEGIGASPQIRADLDELLAVHEPSLVVIDSYTPALVLHGLKPNEGADIEKFNRAVVKPLQARGAAVVIIDHLVKVKENRGKYSIGSERKVGVADVHLGLEVIQPFGRGRHGAARLLVHKDKPGYHPRPRAGEFHLESRPDGRVTWQIKPAEPVAEADRFRPTVLMGKVSRHLEQQTSPASRNSIEEAVRGNREYVRLAMDALVSEGYASETVGARSARLLTFVRPFDSTTSPTSPDFAPTSPGRSASSTSPTSPTPLQGGEVRGEVRGANSNSPDGPTSPELFDPDEEAERIRAKVPEAL